MCLDVASRPVLLTVRFGPAKQIFTATGLFVTDSSFVWRQRRLHQTHTPLIHSLITAASQGVSATFAP